MTQDPVSNLTSNGARDFFLVKLDSTGSFIWVEGYGGIGNELSWNSAVDIFGNVYSTGYFNNTVDFEAENGISTFNSIGLDDIFILKTSNCLFPPIQTNSIIGDTLICEGDSLIYSINLNPSATSYSWNIPSGWNGIDSLNTINVIASSNSGQISVTADNSCGTSNIQVLNVVVNELPEVELTLTNDLFCINHSSFILTGENPSGGIFTGTSVTNGQFDPSSAGTGTHVITYTYTDINGCTNSVTSEITVDLCLELSHLQGENTLRIYPNPFNSYISVSSVQLNLPIEIYNCLGKLVYSDILTTETKSIDLNSINSGIYLLKVGDLVYKIIKE